MVFEGLLIFVLNCAGALIGGRLIEDFEEAMRASIAVSAVHRSRN
jgi:hypothetical protein